MGHRKKRSREYDSALVALHQPHSPIVEQYRTIRTNIEFSSFEKPFRSLLITSGLPGEGKSFSAANLAVVFSQQEKKVLLIDADLRKPATHKIFHLDNRFGVTNILMGKSCLDHVVQHSEAENLDVLTSGPIPPNPAELLSSQAMEELLKEANEQYDLVLLDSPPLLPVADTQILANYVDGSILVILSGKTKLDNALKSREILSSSKSELLGAVLNGRKVKKARQYNSYK
ncbi:CpsD/CapB family tyrosine-protein kinase [Bacillus sp. CLL-7-23]|uniref:non-specific protein-tyrosine kinase n=1 Tax=Bacillus changyiensis TaxID=3004103 RepID=A0ABT4X509_9BACI|nr:CpsD/CapB family tyrosine-protein kinase [Bacillus changyiensis]MDA7027358.1 CpsD/CapB family tyrosine-protein kinase [Bacillus changyiensis]